MCLNIKRQRTAIGAIRKMPALRAASPGRFGRSGEEAGQKGTLTATIDVNTVAPGCNPMNPDCLHKPFMAFNNL